MVEALDGYIICSTLAGHFPGSELGCDDHRRVGFTTAPAAAASHWKIDQRRSDLLDDRSTGLLHDVPPT
jgi:hypothetical protein